MKKFVEVYIPSSEQPPRFVIDTDTGEIPVIEHYPETDGTYERRVDRVTKNILGRVVGVDRGVSPSSSEHIAYRTKPVPLDTVLHEKYSWTA